jgi:uncharacterized protein
MHFPGYHRTEIFPIIIPRILYASTHQSLPMANIAHFMIPADDVGRAKRFYSSLLGWQIEPTKYPVDPAMIAEMQYHDIIAGEAEKGKLNTGGLYRRHMQENILSFVEVEDIDSVAGKVEALGGKIVRGKEEIKGVGLVTMILDSEGNPLGLWKPESR